MASVNRSVAHPQISVLLLQSIRRVRDLLPRLKPFTSLSDEVIHLLLGIQPVCGVLQHVEDLLQPVGQFGLRVFPVSLKPVNYGGRKGRRRGHDT